MPPSTTVETKHEWGPSDGQLATPVNIKLSVKARTQLEMKVQYLINPELDHQQYQASLFMFFPEELEAVHTNLYKYMWQLVRMHTPKVSLLELAQGWGLPHNSLGHSVEAVLTARKEGRDTEQAVCEAACHLQLHACTLRAAIRRERKELNAQLKHLQGAHVAAKQQALAAAIADLICQACGVIQHTRQAAAACQGDSRLQQLQAEWAIVDEFLLLETQQTLLKLLRQLKRWQCGCGSAASTPQGQSPPQPQTLPSNRDSMHTSSAAPLPRDSVQGSTVGAESADSLTEDQSLDGILKQARAWASSSMPEAAGMAGTERQPLPAACSYPQLDSACNLLGQAVASLQGEQRRLGYDLSIMNDASRDDNESYTYRIKVLKRNARKAITLHHKELQPSFWLQDVVGTLFAGFAMAVATAALFLSQVVSGHRQWSIIAVIILITSYMLKDRIKEWGKRYLIPIAKNFGFEFPDRVISMTDEAGKVVGKEKQEVHRIGINKIDSRVLELRHADKGPLGVHNPIIQPERVIHFQKKTEVRWQYVAKQLQAVKGLDDLTVLDLAFLCRHMQPRREAHLALTRSPDGSYGVKKVQCARVYHINLVLRIKTAAAEKAMVLQRARIVLDHDGIQRLEAYETVDLRKAVPPTVLQTIPSALHRASAAITQRAPFLASGSRNRVGNLDVEQTADSHSAIAIELPHI